MTTTAGKGLLLALGAAGVSGISVFVNSYAVKRFGDATVYTTMKNSIAALVLIVAVGSARPGGRTALTRPMKRSHLVGLGVIGFVGGGVPFVLFFEGLAHAAASPVQAQFINKTLVVWVALLAITVLGERLGLIQLGAVALLVVGQAVLSGGLTATLRMAFGRGEAMMLAATLLWAIEVVLAKKLLRALDSWTIALARMGLGSLLLIGWVLVSGRAEGLVGMDVHQWAWVSLTGVLLAAYVGTWLAALALVPAVTVTAVLVLAVPVTAILQAAAGHTALGPQLSGLSLVGLGCTLAAAALLLDRRRRRVLVAG
jgi:drug/metabolite transporter (DMT)-like permease